jgi:CheY-like chemotaxis protein
LTSTKYRIVYAEDDEDDRMFFTDAFEPLKEDIELITFHNGYEAYKGILNMAEEHASPCLVVLDINMPVMSGREVLKLMRSNERLKEIPVVLFTTSSLDRDRSFAKEFNAEFITKPMDARQFTPVIRKFVSYCVNDISFSDQQSA